MCSRNRIRFMPSAISEGRAVIQASSHLTRPAPACDQSSCHTVHQWSTAAMIPCLAVYQCSLLRTVLGFRPVVLKTEGRRRSAAELHCLQVNFPVFISMTSSASADVVRGGMTLDPSCQDYWFLDYQRRNILQQNPFGLVGYPQSEHYGTTSDC